MPTLILLFLVSLLVLLPSVLGNFIFVESQGGFLLGSLHECRL